MDLTAARPTFYGDIGFWADRTPVHEAASLGRVLQLRQLLDDGASVNTVTVDNMTPLHDACIQDHPQCVRMLLDAGAQVDVRNIHGSTALCYACASGSLECVRLLLDHGASVNPSLTALTASPLHEACIRGANVNAIKFHETALHHAAKVSRPDLIELLVEFGGDVNVTDNLGRKAIDYTTSGSPSHTCLQYYQSTPLSLQQLSRITLREMLGTRALQAVTKLDISQRIISYLCYTR
ncbi:ankyrin repeat and SOCS box protein 13a.1 [Hoplias malabaricus]|uniref:ankyrin repeat and SOCS box protein 13a.1 n=1 Tax=Hoplias malabaricus TaxID=27720 RepID=UPI0034636EC5